MTAAAYQYVDLPDASVVTTRALLAARENIGDMVAVRAMMCIHGGAGFGKSLAVNTCLRGLEVGEDVRRVTFRARLTARAVRYELFSALDLAGEPPRHPSEFDRLLKTALAERPRTFLVGEAQWLNGEAFECFCYLWDEPATRFAVVFVGGEGCHSVLRRAPMLSSRIFIWQHFTRLTSSEVFEVIPLFHPVWADAGPEDIAFADSHAVHGNFRAWARLTAHTRTALARTGRPRGSGVAALGLQPPCLTIPPPCRSLRYRRPSPWLSTATTTCSTRIPSWLPTMRRPAGSPCAPALGTTSETGLAHDLLAVLGKPPLLPGGFPAGRQPAWEAATAWMTALPVARLTVLRAHRLTTRGTMRLLELRALTGIHLTLVCHRPHLPAALHQALPTADYSLTTDLDAARRHYHGTPVTEPPLADEPAGPAGRWLTLPALDRLVSYDSPRPCADPCTPPLIIWRHRPPPVPLTAPTAQKVAHRLHAATARPRLAAAVAAALFTGASLQQLATARPRDYDDTVATLALHDRACYTDGCAAHPVPPWAGVFLRAAVCFTRLVSGEGQELLAAPGDRVHLLRVAETARLRPPRPPSARRQGPVGRVEWGWRERREAERYETVPASRVRPSRR